MRIPGLSVELDLEGVPWRTTRVDGVSWLPLDPDADRLPPAAAGERRGAGAREGGAVLIRMAPGMGYEEHRHLGVEYVLVLQGGYRDELGEYTRGAFVSYPAGGGHAPVALGDPHRPADAGNPACVLFAVATGGIELLRR